MFSRRRGGRIKTMTELSSSSMTIPDVTQDSLLRLERYTASPSSATWFDISGSANNGTAADPAMYGDFYFDGVVDQVLTASLEPSANFANEWTLAFWYKRDVAAAAGFSTIMQTRKAGPNGGYIVRDRTNPAPADDYSFEIVDPYAVGSKTVKGTDSNWHFAAMVWTLGPPKTLTGYIDGAVFSTYTTPNSPSIGGVLNIGRGNFYRFAGNIDAVRSYPRALSADEIMRDYNAGKPAH